MGLWVGREGKMFNTHVSKEREVPLWAIGAPAIGVPLMVALLSLSAPKHVTPVDGADLGATAEQVERQAVDHASGLLTHCTGRQSNS